MEFDKSARPKVDCYKELTFTRDDENSFSEKTNSFSEKTRKGKTTKNHKTITRQLPQNNTRCDKTRKLSRQDDQKTTHHKTM